MIYIYNYGYSYTKNIFTITGNSSGITYSMTAETGQPYLTATPKRSGYYPQHIIYMDYNSSITLN